MMVVTNLLCNGESDIFTLGHTAAAARSSGDGDDVCLFRISMKWRKRGTLPRRLRLWVPVCFCGVVYVHDLQRMTAAAEAARR